MYEKVKPVKDAALYRAFFEDHPYCAACGVPTGKAAFAPDCGGIGLSRHHIIRFKRSDEVCNLATLCSRDHNLAEGHQIRCEQTGLVLPTLTLGMVLSIKSERFPDEYDADRLAVLYGRALPDLEPIPEFLEASWRRWRK